MSIKNAVLLSSLLSAISSASARDVDPAKLAQQKACLACHATDKKVLGPSYQDVAKKYAGQKDALATVTSKILQGSTGAWGGMAMPAQAVTDAEAKTLAQWVLKQK